MISIIDFLNVYGVIGCIAALLWVYSRSSFNYWRKLNVNYLKPIPLFGNTAGLIFLVDTFHEAYHKLYKALGNEPYGGFYQMRQPQLMVKDPQLVSAILIKDFNNFHDRGMSFLVNKNRKLNPMMMHLFFTDGERWKALRQKMSPVFTSGKLKQMQDQISNCVALMTKFVDQQMDGQGSMDVALKDLFEKLTIDVIGSCAFGIECDSLKSNEGFTQMCRNFFQRKVGNAVRMLLASFSPKLLDLLRFPDMRQDVSDFFLKLTLDTMEYRRQHGLKRNDLMQLLMELQNSHVDPKFAVGEPDKKVLASEQFDEIDVAANSVLFFVAGFETTASTLSYCLYELALNQDIQDRLRSELQQIRTECETFNYENLRQLTYMNAVIAETLRKYPPVVVLNRECTEDYVIPGTKTQVTTGTQVTIPVWSIHHDWRNYPNPEVFNPERFLGDNKHSIPTGAYLPFGEGPKYCLGKRFAEMEIKAALAEMIWKFNIKPCSKTEIPLRYKPGYLVLQTQCGTWVNIEKKKY